jgi:hypothetical protein
VESDAARRLVVERNLVASAFAHLTDAFTALPFDALGPVKTLLKRYLSAAPWGPEDDDALAAAVGAGEGRWRRDLDDDVAIGFGWVDGRFGVAVLASGAAPTPRVSPPAAAPADPLADTFDGPVVPEATPNPRTIRFGFAHPVQDGPSRWYESAEAASDDPRVHRLFAGFDRVANVLVGPDFVAVGLRRPDDWEALLAPVLVAVTEQFADPDQDDLVAPASAGPPPWFAGRPPAANEADGTRRLTRLEQAWRDLGSLRPADSADLATVLAAASAPDPSHRQVAANLLREADPATARDQWSRLAVDPARAVRRATVDAMVDAGRDDLRPLFESALDDADAWVRWKALRGLVELGPGPSRDRIATRASDPDFRVRLEAAAALRATAGAGTGPPPA